jgi:hypothetical protein
MPRYFFDVKNGHRLIDPLASIAAMIKRPETEPSSSRDRSQWMCRTLPGGRHVAEVTEFCLRLHVVVPVGRKRYGKNGKPTKEQIIHHAYELWEGRGVLSSGRTSGTRINRPHCALPTTSSFRAIARSFIFDRQLSFDLLAIPIALALWLQLKAPRVGE